MNYPVHANTLQQKTMLLQGIGTNPRQILLAMKLALLLLLAFSLHATADALAQKIDIQVSNQPLDVVFKKIREQSDYSFVFKASFLQYAKPVTVAIKDKEITDVLPIIFAGQPFDYEIKGKVITLLPKPQVMPAPNHQITIRGRVTDSLGNPLVGVTVQVKESGWQTITDRDGRYEITGVYPTETLHFRLLSYEPFETPANRPEINVTLRLLQTEIEEVEINAGYYTIKERERTGNISKVTATAIEKQPINNPLQALQNRVPGMVITQQTGVPGGGITVQIRGRSSLNVQVGNEPLYVIDGIIYPSSKASLNYVGNILGTAGVNPLGLINPNDIESIEILKDADATAIYGSKGANGVVLIKTKRGEAGVTRVNANFVQGFSKVASHLDLLNTEQYLEMRKEAIANEGATPTSTDFDVNGVWDQNKYTDWQKLLIGNTAPSTKAALGFSGGTEMINYLLSGNYYKENTVFPGDLNFTRTGIQSNINFGTEKSRLNVGFTTNYNHTNNKLIRTDLTSLITLAPNAPDPYDQYGQLNWEDNTVYRNPMSLLLAKNNIVTDNLISNLKLNYKIVNGFSLSFSAGYNLIKTDEFNKLPLAYTSPANNPTSANRRSYFSDITNRTWIAEPQLNYNKTIRKGNFDALVGLSLQENISDIRSVIASNFSSDALMENMGAAALIQNGTTSYSQYRYMAGYARFNYNLNKRYFINLTARRDGSSRFGGDKQFANFGAIGSAWIFSEEDQIRKNFKFLSFGKLRASYGITGNDQIPDYGYLQLYNSAATYQGFSTVVLSNTNIGNPDFAWETNKKLEFAIQLGFFKNRINIEASWYRNQSSNQLIGDALPLSTGSMTVRANRPALVANTGIEILSNFMILQTDSWEWTTTFNLTVPESKVVAYPGLEQSGDAFNYIIGQPISIYKVYNFLGVNDETGLYEFEDYDANGVLDNNDRYLHKFTGQYYYGGIQNNIRYRKFTLDFLLGFTKQNGYNYISTMPSPGLWSSSDYPNGNQPKFIMKRWQAEGDLTEVQKFSTISSSRSPYYAGRNFGGLNISDASYLRLKNVAFAYAIPENWLRKYGIERAALVFSAQNIFTITRYKGLDPETQSMNMLPPLKTFATGINVTF